MDLKIKCLVLSLISLTLISCASFEIPTILDSKNTSISNSSITSLSTSNTSFDTVISSNTSIDSSVETILNSSSITSSEAQTSSNNKNSSIITSYVPDLVTVRFVYKDVIKENNHYVFQNVIDDSLVFDFLRYDKVTSEIYNSIYFNALNSLHAKNKENFKFIGFEGINAKFEPGLVIDGTELEFSYGFISLVNYNTSYTKESDTKELSLNTNNYYNIGEYETGNYANRYTYGDINTIDNCTFEHYRGVHSYNGFIKLLPYTNTHNDYSIGGSLYNVTEIEKIKHISLSYTTNDQGDDLSFTLNFGKTNNQENSYVLNSSTELITAEIDVEDVSFIKFYTDSLGVDIKEINIYYQGNVTSKKMEYQTVDGENHRINPTSYEGELIDGVSKVDMPISLSYFDNYTYKINETKSYTYYSNDYVNEHPEVASKAAITEPMDIINYYLAFHEYPANFVKNINNYLRRNENVFGSKLRQVSNIYSRTDGYVNAVPYNKSNFSYVEFDVDIDNSYFVSESRVSRGVGRVIIFETGFINDGYDASPVGIFTDDHYATFQEYYNNGIFSKRFNAQARETLNEYLNVSTYDRLN